MPTPAYTRVQIALHWLTAATVLTAYFTHDAMEEIAREIWRAGGTPVPTVHTIAGFLTFLLVLARLTLRWRRGGPEPLAEGAARTAAVWGHRLLYLLLIAVPLGGVLTWFGGLRDLGELHGLAGKALMIVAAGHAAIALVHHFVLKDGTLRRMLNPG